MPTVTYPKNPNTDTAFVVQEDGKKNSALMIAPQDISTLELPSNPNSTKGYVTVDGKKQRVILTADISGNGGGSSLPDQTGQSGKFLTTDGTDASWSNKPLVNQADSSKYSLAIGGVQLDQSKIGYYNLSITKNSPTITTGNRSTTVGYSAVAAGQRSVAIGYNAKTDANAISCIQIAGGDTNATNSDANTFKVANANGNYEIMSADGTIPEARLADTTTAQQGDVLTLDSTGNAVWQAGGGDGLPDQTGNAGKFLTTDGTDASWSDKPLVNSSTGMQSLAIGGTAGNYGTAVGQGSKCSSAGTAVGQGANSGTGVALGGGAIVTGIYGIAIGSNARAMAANAIQITTHYTNNTNSDANTFKVGNANGNYEIMSADGTIPAARHASLPAADGTYVLKLVIASGVPTLSWVAE